MKNVPEGWKKLNSSRRMENWTMFLKDENWKKFLMDGKSEKVPEGWKIKYSRRLENQKITGRM